MIIKWLLEDIKPDQSRGLLAMSDDGNYQIVFDYNSLLHFYVYRNSNCIYACNVECDITGLCISDLLVKCHRQIEIIEKNSSPIICGKCYHLIFKDYRHHEGLCNLVRLHRNFEDICVNEDIAENDRITNG